MHHRLTPAIYVLAIGTCVLGYVPTQYVLVVVAAIAVAVVGVPHGGLDHWTGRRWLQPRLGGAWWSLFFPAYLAVAIAVAAGWLWLPLVTALTFFLLSAWHFGLDDEPLGLETGWSKHLLAIALGGLVIWVPAVCRAEEMNTILSAIIPNEWSLSASAIVTATQFLAALFLPIAAVAMLFGFNNIEARPAALRYLLLAIVCMTTPILMSFGLYFCLWHSVRGLNGLYKTSGLSMPRFAVAVLPLSLAAVGMVAVGSLALSQGNSLPATATQALFIGLSAMAVPHLVLHGFDQSQTASPKRLNASNPTWVTS